MSLKISKLILKIDNFTMIQEFYLSRVQETGDGKDSNKWIISDISGVD